MTTPSSAAALLSAHPLDVLLKMELTADIPSRPQQPKLIYFISANVLFLILFSISICGCHFHSIAVAPTALAIVYNAYIAYTALKYKRKILGYTALLVLALQTYIGWGSNISLYFHNPFEAHIEGIKVEQASGANHEQP